MSVSKKVIALGSIGAALAAASISWAAIPDNNGVIHGCYRTTAPSQGQLRVIDSSKT